jgi:hypothetical protein
MRFPNPVAVTCSTCGRPTVMAETLFGLVRVHCGTWRWQCDALGTGHEKGSAMPIGPTAPGTPSDQELAA